MSVREHDAHHCGLFVFLPPLESPSLGWCLKCQKEPGILEVVEHNGAGSIKEIVSLFIFHTRVREMRTEEEKA